MEGVTLLRGRKEDLEKKALAAHTLYENVLSSSLEEMEAGTLMRSEDQHRRIESIEEAISQCEEQALEADLREGRGNLGGSVLEKLTLPKFSGNPLEYAEFKALFTELVGSVRMKEVAIMEYLRRSLDNKLCYIIHGAKDRGEAWKRLDEHFADRTGSIQSILKGLMVLDLSKGRTYMKLDKLKNEIDHATYLLKGLRAELHLTGDMDMVSSLVRKLLMDHCQDWVKWSTTRGEELHPGENE